MNEDFKKDLEQIVHVIYCDIGSKEMKKRLEYIKPFCLSEESLQIMKIVKQEIKNVDRRMEEYRKSMEGQLAE